MSVGTMSTVQAAIAAALSSGVVAPGSHEVPPATRYVAESSVDLEGAPGFLRGVTSSARAFGSGALAGKTIYVSPGHGLYWTGSTWLTMRPNLFGVIEDLMSVESVSAYLIPYLHAMGAYVVPFREPDTGSQRVIVDDPEAILEGAPQEMPTSDIGWGHVALPISSDDVRPFETGGARALVAQSQESGGLVFAPDLPASSHHHVYVSFVEGPDRVADAHYVVRHSGGETHFRIDQRRHGGTWVLLGEFHFDAGMDPDRGAVVVLDDSDSPGGIVSADAVRFGGGMAMYDRGGGTSDRIFSDTGARLYTHWNGAPASVFDGGGDTEYLDDYHARPRFAAWDHDEGEDAVYVAWHTDALNGATRGTSSWCYPGGGVPGSQQLRDLLHAEVVGDLRAGWDPDWVDRGLFTESFMELHVDNNDEVPAALVEIGYHDHAEEVQAVRDPRVRRIAARAVAQAIARYFAERDGVPLVLAPEPPTALWLRNDGDGALVAGWTAPEPEPGAGDPAEDWVVELSTNGDGFDDGTLVTDTEHRIEGLSPGEVVYLRVRGHNAGGVSLPSQVVAAAVAPSGTASVLVVAGFDRLDGAMLVPDDASAIVPDDPYPRVPDIIGRMLLRRMNDGSYAARHAAAISAAGFSLDGATDDAVELGEVQLGGYQAVDWFAGEDSTGNDPLNDMTRDALADYLDGGGRLLLSGAELAFALDEYGTEPQRTFFHERLHTSYAADDAETYDVVATPGPLEAVAPLSFMDPTAYDPRFPDVLAAEPGGAVVLAYDDASGEGAAVAWGIADDDGDRGVLLGFPFETISGETARNDVMARVLAFFGTTELPGEDDDDTTAGDSGDDADTSGSADGVSMGDAGDSPTSSDGTDTGEDGGVDDPGGCGCHSAGEDERGWMGSAILAALASRVRRRKRRASPASVRYRANVSV